MIRYLLILFLLVSGYRLVAQVNLNLDFIKRNALPNLARKIKGGASDTIAIAFLGGSITEASNGWRDQSINWLKNQYSKAKIKQINAGIGGTGSSLGVYRLSEQVLKYNPDLVFVEFAVNDYNETRKSILESFEGIVRQIWKANPKTDICFIYTLAVSMLEDYQKGFLPNSVSAIEEIASHYNIPSVNFAPGILTKLENKDLFMQGKQGKSDSLFFSPDGVHPYPETGHAFYQQTLSRYFPSLIEQCRDFKHKLGNEYFSEALERSVMIDIGDAMLVNYNKEYVEDEEIKKKFSRLLPQIRTLKNEKESIEFTFTGNKVGFLDIIGPESTQLKIEIDKDAPRYVTRFDKFGSFSRMHWFFIENLNNVSHRIKISISTNKINKAEILGKKLSELDNRELYKREVWRVGKILLMSDNQ